MPFSPATYEEKPYNRCIDCVHIGKQCDGPNFLAMEMPRLSEWSRLRKAFLQSKDPKWTNAYIAECAGLSKTTVDRFLSGDLDDIKLSTAARIIKVLVDGTWGQYPCSLAAGESGSSESAKIECEYLRSLLESEQRKVSHLKEQVDFRGGQMISKDKLLDEHADFLRLKDKTIRLLAGLLGLCVVIIIGFFVMDFMNPVKGFFWLH